MIPHEIALVEGRKDQPFALLGVNTDSMKPADLAKKLAEQKITWRSAVEGKTTGPIFTAWIAHAFPTIYVLDARGAIRFKNVRGPQLDEAVDALLKEMKGR